MPQKMPAKGNIKREAGLSRLEKLRLLRQNMSLSSLLVSDSIDASYISGFLSSNVSLLIGPRKNSLITDFRYETAARRFCARHPEWTYQPSALSTTKTIAAHLKPSDRCGFQADRMTVDELAWLKKAARQVKFVACGAQIAETLCSKLSSEIRCMAAAARIGDAAFSRLLGDIRPGISEKTLADHLESYCRELGSEKPSFDTIVLCGARSALPHGRPGAHPLRRGDFVLIDFGCVVDGFCSDMTRTVVIGKASARQRDIYHIVLDAQEYARKTARAGMTAQQIDALARDRITDAGYETQFGHALGHGVGRRIHEAPRISAQVPERVPENTVITIEPGIYIPGFGGVRIEDMTILTPRGTRTLTNSPRELLEL